MIRAVANFFAAVIGILIILAVTAIVIGIKFATDANADEQLLMSGLFLVATGIVALFSMGLSCVMLDIMFNVRKIAEKPKIQSATGGGAIPRTEPQFSE